MVVEILDGTVPQPSFFPSLGKIVLVSEEDRRAVDDGFGNVDVGLDSVAQIATLDSNHDLTCERYDVFSVNTLV